MFFLLCRSCKDFPLVTFKLMSGFKFWILLFFWIWLWLWSNSLVQPFRGGSWLGCWLNRCWLYAVSSEAWGLCRNRRLSLWGGRLADLLLPFAELLLEPAIVFLDVAPEQGWQGVYTMQDLACLIICVFWVDVLIDKLTSQGFIKHSFKVWNSIKPIFF